MGKQFIAALIITLIGFEHLNAQWVDMRLVNTTNPNMRWTDLLFQNGDTGILLGRPGMLARTVDKGETWAIDTINTNWQFYKISFPSRDTGYIIGLDVVGAVFKTTDGGHSWLNIAPTYNFYHPLSIHCFSNDHLMVAGGPFMYETYDGGITWTWYNTPSAENNYNMQFTNDSTVYAKAAGDSREGYIIKSVDTGRTWNIICPRFSFDQCYSGVFKFIDDTTAYIQDLRRIYKTTDKLETYPDEVHRFPSEGYYASPVFMNAGYMDLNNLCIVGRDTIFVGTQDQILRSTDGGIIFTETYIPPGSHAFCTIACLDNNTCFAMGRCGLLLKTSNGGGLATGIPDPGVDAQKHDVSVFPNPVNDILTLNLSAENIDHLKDLHIDIYNASGICVHQQVVNGPPTIDLNMQGFENGIYFVSISGSGLRKSIDTKFVKE